MKHKWDLHLLRTLALCGARRPFTVQHDARMNMVLPESPLSAAPTAPSSPSGLRGFKLDDTITVRYDQVQGEQEQEQTKQDQDVDYFAEAEKAKLQIEDEEDEKDFDDGGPPVVAVVFARNGDVHFCRGSSCPMLELNADRSYVCKISNIVCGAKAVREDDSTGRMTGSANPDDLAGGAHYGPRTDAFAASSKAFEDAESRVAIIDESTLFVAAKKRKRGTRDDEQKRGAHCVDNKPAQEYVPKATRRTANTNDQYALLLREAEVVLSKLVAHAKKPEAEEKTLDPRLCDRQALFEAAAVKYVKAQEAAAQPPNLSELHDLALACARVASANRAKMQAQRDRSGRAALLLKPVARQKVVALCVSVWLASCNTPYMRDHAKNTESFRPAISGILYGLKRGVQLESGEFLVPACPELCEALPVLRGTEANSAAKSLHAASHSGLRTLHRSIASCLNAKEHFKSCIAQSKEIAADVAAGRFDI